MLNAKLLVVGGGNAKVSEIQLKLPTVIGRSREAKLKLPHPLVSRRHCEVFEREGQLFVRDLGSLNGTYVNSQRIESEHVLQPNQLLTLGTVTFRAIYDAAQPSGNGQNHEPVALAPAVADERPTDRADQEPDAQPAHLPVPQSELDTESGPVGSDTDENLLDLDAIEFFQSDDAEKGAEVSSSIFVDCGEPSGNGSVSLSEIANLPGQAAPLSFVGGVEVDDNRTTQTAPTPSALPKIDTGGSNKSEKKQSKRRPR